MPDGCSATLEHMHNDRQMKAHFTNMMPISFDPAYNRVHTDFDKDLDSLQNLLPEKCTAGYKPDA